MATGSGTEPGKGTFVREFFASHNDANEESVNEAWAAEGREGTISVSLISKIKAELGLTNRGRGPGRPKGVPNSKPKTKGKGRKVARLGGRTAPSSDGELAPTRRSSAGMFDSELLDELEGDLDDLIQKIKDAGEMPEVIQTLRRARRMLVRSHEG